MSKRIMFRFWIGLLMVTVFLYGCPKKQPSPAKEAPKSKSTYEESENEAEEKRLLEEKKRFEEEQRRLAMEKARLEAERLALKERREREAKEKWGKADILPNPAREGTIEEEQGLKDISFVFDKFDVRGNAVIILQRNSEWLLNNTDIKILIEGHCDERGTSEYNLALGEKRALATKKYLVSLGVPAGRLHTISYGEELPLDPGHNEAAWSKNRRAHFLITTK